MKEFPPAESFRTYLKALAPDEIVSQDWGCCTCPLAIWLVETRQASEPYIVPGICYGAGEGGTWRDLGEEDLENPGEPDSLPAWANDFAQAIDALAEVDGPAHPHFRAVTAAECLAILDKVGAAA